MLHYEIRAQIKLGMQFFKNFKVKNIDAISGNWSDNLVCEQQKIAQISPQLNVPFRSIN